MIRDHTMGPLLTARDLHTPGLALDVPASSTTLTPLAQDQRLVRSVRISQFLLAGSP